MGFVFAQAPHTKKAVRMRQPFERGIVKRLTVVLHRGVPYTKTIL